jgi:hypothetical protein
MQVDEKNEKVTLKFKSPLWSVIWLLFIGNLLGFILLALFIIKQKAHLTVSLLHIFGVVGIMALVVDVFVGLILIESFKVKLKPNGISCCNIWGIYSFVLWDEMREVKTINFLGLKYARVFFRTAYFPLWVPLFIKNRNEFSKALSEFAPASNLLRQVFEQN